MGSKIFFGFLCVLLGDGDEGGKTDATRHLAATPGQIHPNAERKTAMLSFIRRLFRPTPTIRRPRRTHLNIESLEARDVPTVFVTSFASQNHVFAPDSISAVACHFGADWPSGALSLGTADPVALYVPWTTDSNGVLTCYSYGTGVHTLSGPVRAEYLAIGGVNSILGYPTTDMALTPDFIGWYSNFENGANLLFRFGFPTRTTSPARVMASGSKWAGCLAPRRLSS